MKNNKKQTLAKVLTILFIVSISLESIASINNVQAQIGSAVSPFSIIWISDTQHLSEHSPAYYDNLCQWIVENNQTYNVKMVVHTGDLVEMEDDTIQWENANHSMSILLENDIPYCWDAGNHDYNEYLWIGNQYVAFNTSIMEQKPYWVNQTSDGKSTAVHFSVSGWDCLIINIAYHADDTVLNWAENLLTSYPDSHVIVATHAYINPQCKYDFWATNLKNILDRYPNVFLTLSGHYYFPTYTNRTQSGNRYELMFDMQNIDEEELGASTARILIFNLVECSLSVQTYAVYANQFLVDNDNNFILYIKNAVPDGLFEAPEYSFGAVVALVACFISLITFKVFKNGLVHYFRSLVKSSYFSFVVSIIV